MKELSTEELKKIQLDIMSEIDEYCKKNKLTYYLAAGTLIGAVRHKGYIPWDDDIDIFMKRNDYDKFIKNFFSGKGFKIVSPENDKKYYLPFAKVIDTNTILKEEVNTKFDLGVYVDVFPLDSINEKDFCKFYIKQKLLINMLNLKNLALKKRNIFKNLIVFTGKIILLPFPKKILIAKINKNAKKYRNNQCDCLANLMLLMYGKGDLWKEDYFNDVVYLDFEKNKYLCPKEYDKILTKTYGDYMKFPPKEKQVTHHSFKAYFK